jgi:hypothetical protein
MLPFDDSDDEDPRVVMNLIPELAIIFETKKRAPIRVVYETVKLSEIRERFLEEEAQELN